MTTPAIGDLARVIYDCCKTPGVGTITRVTGIAAQFDWFKCRQCGNIEFITVSASIDILPPDEFIPIRWLVRIDPNAGMHPLPQREFVRA